MKYDSNSLLRLYEPIGPTGHVNDVWRAACAETVNPILLLDMKLNPLVDSGDIATGGMQDILSEILPDARTLNYKTVLQEPDPVNSRSTGMQWLVCPIVCQNTCLGYGLLCGYIEPLTEEDGLFLKTLCRAAGIQLGHSMLHGLDHYGSPLSHELFFKELLFRDQIRSPHIMEQAGRIKWRALENMYVLCIPVSEDKPDKYVLSFVRNNLAGYLPVYTCTMHQGMLAVLLYYGSRVCDDSITEQVERIFLDAGLRGARSLRFNNIADIHKAFEQACLSLIVAEYVSIRERYISYERIGLYHVLYVCKQYMDYDELLHRSIPALLEYDEKNHTSLLQTLFVYLQESKNTSRTAAHLHIHRNTLLYRIQKIKDLTNVDLDDGNEVLFIQFSFRVLIFNHTLPFDHTKFRGRNMD